MIVARTGYTPAPPALLAAMGVLMALPFAGYCQSRGPAANEQQSQSAEVNRIIDRIVTGEKQYTENLRKYSPRVETYLQFDLPDPELGDTATNDAHFLGRMNFGSKPEEISFIPGNPLHWLRSGLETIATPFLPPTFS